MNCSQSYRTWYFNSISNLKTLSLAKNPCSFLMSLVLTAMDVLSYRILVFTYCLARPPAKIPWVLQVRERKFSAILIPVKFVGYFMRQRKGMVWCNWFIQANFKSTLQAAVTPFSQEGCNVIEESLVTSSFLLVSATFGNADHVIIKICVDKNKDQLFHTNE